MPDSTARDSLDQNTDDGSWLKRRGQSQEIKARRLGAGRDSRRRSADGDLPLPAVGEFGGRVAETQRYSCVLLQDGDYLMSDLRESTLPVDSPALVVGDRVSFDLVDDRPVLRQLLPRQTKLVRMRSDRGRRSSAGREEHILAANIDIAVIVASAAAPPFRPRLIDRYLVLCRYGQVTPVICINKCDLDAERPDLSFYGRMAIPVIFASVVTGEGLDELRASLQGKFSILTGHSGVGKSSILNELLEDEVQETQEVGQRDGLGRHTTTSSSLHQLDRETYLIDTPGIRSLGLWDIDRHTLPMYFPEFARYAPDCRFRDCRHEHEPVCEVKEAVARGELPQGWYDSYLRMAGDGGKQ